MVLHFLQLDIVFFVTSRRYECISHSTRSASSLSAMLSGTVEFACTCSPLAREPEIVNCQVGHVECFVRENFQLKKGKLEIRQSERRLSSSGVGRRPFDEVECQRAACSGY